MTKPKPIFRSPVDCRGDVIDQLVRYSQWPAWRRWMWRHGWTR
jgi:hypothetical protein